MQLKHKPMDNSDELIDSDIEDNYLEESDQPEDNTFTEDLDFDDYKDSQPPMEKYNDLLRKLTDFDPFLQKQVMEWLGMYWDSDKKEYVKDPEIDPIMNIKGARWCVNFLRTYARDNNIITNIDHDVYCNIMIDIIETTFFNIGTRAEYFGIQNDGDILAVCNQLIHTSDLVLIGAGGSKTYTDFLSTTTSRSENVSLNDQQNQNQQIPKKPGFIPGLKKYMGF